MAGKLVQVSKLTITSDTQYGIVTGISTDDIYLVTYRNMRPNTDAVYFLANVTVGGSRQTGSNYSRASKNFRSASSFGNGAGTNETSWYIQGNTNGTAQGEVCNGYMILYNFNNSSSNSHATVENSSLDHGANHNGTQGARWYTTNQTNDGISFNFSGGGQIASGEIVLYRYDT